MVNREQARARQKQTNKKKQRRQISYVDLARARKEATKRAKKIGISN